MLFLCQSNCYIGNVKKIPQCQRILQLRLYFNLSKFIWASLYKIVKYVQIASITDGGMLLGKAGLMYIHIVRAIFKNIVFKLTPFKDSSSSSESRNFSNSSGIGGNSKPDIVNWPCLMKIYNVSFEIWYCDLSEGELCAVKRWWADESYESNDKLDEGLTCSPFYMFDFLSFSSIISFILVPFGHKSVVHSFFNSCGMNAPVIFFFVHSYFLTIFKFCLNMIVICHTSIITLSMNSTNYIYIYIYVYACMNVSVIF